MTLISALKYLIVLMLLISAIALTADIISVYIAPFESKGTISFTYAKGEAPITHISYEFEGDFGDNLAILKVPEGWSYVQTSSGLILSGGQLLLGDTLTVETSLKRYVAPGNKTFTATATTTKGETISTNGVLSVTETIILKIMYLLFDYRMPILGSTVALALLESFLMFTKRGKGPPTLPPSIVTLPPSIVFSGPLPPFPEDYPKIPKEAPDPVITQGPEEEKRSERKYLIYVVSDLHMGSHLKYDLQKLRKEKEKDGSYSDRVVERWKVDKSDSNAFDEEQAKRFIRWLQYISFEHSTNYPDAECHLIINGDLLDLWQAKVRPFVGDYGWLTEEGDKSGIPCVARSLYRTRIDWILDEKIRRYYVRWLFDEEDKFLNIRWDIPSEEVGENPNYKVIKALLEFASGPNRIVVYLIGNHDDPLYARSRENDPAYDEGLPDSGSLRKYLESKLDNIRGKEGLPVQAATNFYIGRFYWNRDLGVYAEHGHIYDDDNWNGEKICNGQGLTEGPLLEAEESGVGSFWGLFSLPETQWVQYLKCELEYAETHPGREDVRALIAKFIEESAEALSVWKGALEDIATLHMSLSILEKHFSPVSVLGDAQGRKQIIEEEDRKRFADSKALKTAINASVICLGHTHRPCFRKYDDDSVYVNTAEWIYNIKFESEPRCRLDKIRGYDYYLKIQPFKKIYEWEQESPDLLSVELYYWPAGEPSDRIASASVKRRIA